MDAATKKDQRFFHFRDVFFPKPVDSDKNGIVDPSIGKSTVSVLRNDVSTLFDSPLRQLHQ